MIAFVVKLIVKERKCEKNLVFYKTLFCLLLKKDCAQTIFANLILILLKSSSRKFLLSTQLQMLDTLLRSKSNVAKYALQLHFFLEF